MTEFVSGAELNRALYREVVAPIVDPWTHSAALIGYGSQVLGYDDETSTDHGWGLRVEVFVDESNVRDAGAAVDALLPETFAGWPMRYSRGDHHGFHHHVTVTALGEWLIEQVGFDARRELSPVDWLVMPQQRLLEIARGHVYHDGLDVLRPLQAKLAWYPEDVWRYLLTCQWRRIDQEEAFVGRTASVGDELGSRIVAARMMREVMRLHFLYARVYWPYSKWFGTAYNELPSAEPMQELTDAYETVARLHNASGLTDPIEPTVRPFYNRPFLVIGGRRFVDALLPTIGDERLRALPLIGSIDQFVDSTDVLSYPEIARRLRAAYET